ncbi:MAG: tellurite resistance/C4-dicarboxylate transporter family protein, partial [Acidimicrobiaceae bacterium]|nr:tellurite resistance/C4-dicarboxylate transporter family protein [Acidimicrobiaceae bacterium]
LEPGYFACVMATGIVSVSTELLHRHVLSVILLVVTAAAFALLGAAYLIRAVAFRPRMLASVHDPAVAMGYFTLVAGTNVLAIRLLMAGHPLATLILGLVAAVAWLCLSYGLPWAMMFGSRRPVLGDINGTWLTWVVATQSVAIVAGGLAADGPWRSLHQDLAVVAVVYWGAGIILYLILIVIVFLRLFLVEVTPSQMGPAYWIAMGATAISVRAAAGIPAVHDPATSRLVADMHPVLIGMSVILWSFGTWWIPLLVLFGFWRYILRHYPVAYEPRLWSVVFPLGMYTVASYSLGSTSGLGFMNSMAHVWLWVGVLAWAATTALLLVAVIRGRRGPRSREPEGRPSQPATA